MLKKDLLYSFQDITIIPAVSTDIKSRKECDPFRKSITGSVGYYPLIASPMDSVVDSKNWSEYHKNLISAIVPRTVPLKDRIGLCTKVFCAFGLKEVEEEFLEKDRLGYRMYVLIDIANGQMLEEIELGKQLKAKYNDRIVLMGGNIAHPATYLLYDAAGFDFLRCSVGTGNACLTSTNTGIGYGSASLIAEISEMKYRYHSHCKIIADGGMTGYSDIIKALALGADYVMCGKIFALAAKEDENVGDPIVYRGMSTKEAQKAMGNSKLKTAEGRVLNLTKKYTLAGWVENFDSYLRSAMSYCDSRSLKEFREKAVCQVVSSITSNNINDK